MKKNEKKAKNLILIICAYLLVNGVFIALCSGGFLFEQFFLDKLGDGWYLSEVIDSAFLTYLYLFGFGSGIVLLFIYYDLKKKYINNKKAVSWKNVKVDLIAFVFCVWVFQIALIVMFDSTIFFMLSIINIILILLVIFSQSLKEIALNNK